jgi:probable HAF family extracellular repeat protein
VSLLVAFCLLACDHDDTDKTLIAICDQGTTARGIAVTVDVIGNDTDSSGNELTLADVTQAMHGTVTINTDDTVTYIPVPDFDGSDSFSYTLSNARGSSANATVTVTVLPESGMVLLGTLYLITPIVYAPPRGTIVTSNLGINDHGQIVGWRSGIDPLAYLFDHGAFQDLLVGSSSVANDINNHRDIVGSFGDSFCNGIPIITHGFLLSGNDSMMTIDFPGINAPPSHDLCAQNFTFANGINDASQVVGTFTDANGTHGFLMTGDTFTQIDIPGATETRANGINHAGQVVGTFTDANGMHGFFMVNDTFSTFDIPQSQRGEVASIIWVRL